MKEIVINDMAIAPSVVETVVSKAVLGVSGVAKLVAPVANGIKGIVSFTMEHFSVPAEISVRQIDIVSSIQELVFETNNEE